MTDRPGFYLNKQNNKLMGVCAGIADYTGMDVFLVRILTLLLLFVTGGAVVLIYLIFGMLADPKPVALTSSQLSSADQVPPFELERLRATVLQLEQRVRELETYYTSSSTSLAREIDRLRD